jgi:hypothetical protein
MMENAPLVGSGASASLLLGRKLDSIPFSIYHVQIILVLGVVGFVEGYDVALGGSLLVLAKEPLHLTPEQIRWLAVVCARAFAGRSIRATYIALLRERRR